MRCRLGVGCLMSFNGEVAVSITARDALREPADATATRRRLCIQP